MLTVAKKIIRSFLMIVTGIVGMTCSESLEVIPNNPPGTTNPPVTEISDEDRLKVLNECAKFVELLGDLTSDVAQQALVQWLQTRPEFKEAGISDKNVWAYFHDGQIAMFVPNWEGAKEEGGRLSMPESSAANNTTPSSAGRTQGVPQTNTVTLFYGLGKIFKDYRQSLKDLFTKSNTSYKVDLKDASIENLKAVKNLGIFYIQTHGGGALESQKPGGGAFGLWTTNPVTPENEKLYKADHNAYRLLYMYALEDDGSKPVWHYAITKQFVNEYMTFAENALQYIDGCNGATSNAIPFRDVIMKKAANGKATYLGWTTPMAQSEGEPTSRYLLDRLLGTHDEGVPMEDPIQRPFDVAAIFQDLKSFKLGVTSHGGVLTYHSTTSPSKAILTPSIEYLTMHDYESDMFVKGLFGEDPGKDGIVTVDGISVPVEWSEELLICHLPHTGRGSSGDVVVSVRGNKSNVVPLSDWTIPLNVSFDQLGMTTEAILNLRLRADIHSYRSKPGESPRPPRGDSIMLLYDNTLGYPFAKGSTGTYSVGGQSRVTCKLNVCEVTDNKTVIPRSGELPYVTTPDRLGFVAYYKWSMDMKKLTVAVDVNIPDVGVEFESSTVCPGLPTSKVSKSMAVPFGIHHFLDPLTRFELILDDNFTIASGRKLKSLGGAPAECRGTLQMESTAQWSSTAAAFPPKKDTEARQGVIGQ